MQITSLPSPRRLGALVAVAPIAALLAGCGLSNPNTATLGSTAASSKSPSATTVAAPSAAPTNQPTSRHAGGRTEQAAIAQYARLWCNWTTADLRSHERQLESLSVGGARTQEQLALAAAPSRSDSDVGQSAGRTNVTNTCTVESLAAGRGNAAGKWVLVTASRTTTSSMQALPPQYHVTYVTLAHRGRRYLVDAWLPQS